LTVQVEIVDFVAGARNARGVVVVIDVFRAFTVACHAFLRGAERIIPVGDADEARRLLQAHSHYVGIGERHARPLPGFHFGNSPTLIEQADLAGRTVVQTTHSGTQGLVNAIHADTVFTGALVNATATCKAILALRPVLVTLVRMGQEGVERCWEDDLCADLLAAVLTGREYDKASVRERLRPAPSAAKFFDPRCDWAPERDFELATAVDACDFALQLVRSSSPPQLVRLPA